MLTPSEFVDAYAAIGRKKAEAPAAKLFILAVLAGFLIGMGGAVSNTASYAVENTSAAKIICGVLFPFGLVTVILTGAELFTGNCLIAVSVLSEQTDVWKMLRNFVIVYLGNFIGAAALSAACVYGGQLDLSNGALALATIKTASAKCSLSFGKAITLGILCNILVCAAVMCALCAADTSGRTIGAYIPVSFFVICGFEHCVANMYYIPAGILALTVPKYAALASKIGMDFSTLEWHSFLCRNLLPVTLGNFIGGCAFAFLIWAGHRKR